MRGWTAWAAASMTLHLSCGGTPPREATPEEMRRLYPEMFVQLSKAEPPPYCEHRGEVQAHGSSAGEAYGRMRKQAAERGANYVVLDAVVWGMGFTGRAYYCPPPEEAVSTKPATGAPGCEPPCSPGYACLRGECVSACNPPCPDDQRCGADRNCHPVECPPGDEPASTK